MASQEWYLKIGHNNINIKPDKKDTSKYGMTTLT